MGEREQTLGTASEPALERPCCLPVTFQVPPVGPPGSHTSRTSPSRSQLPTNPDPASLSINPSSASQRKRRAPHTCYSCVFSRAHLWAGAMGDSKPQGTCPPCQLAAGLWAVTRCPRSSGGGHDHSPDALRGYLCCFVPQHCGKTA